MNHQIMKNLCTLLVSILCLSLVSCAKPPKPLRGEFLALSPSEFVKSPQINSKVRWTGFVVNVENHEEHSCLNILGKIPDAYGKPSRNKRQGTGRFLACKAQFLDPDLFSKKPVTVIGHAKKIIQRTVGKHEVSQPLVDAQVIYVW